MTFISNRSLCGLQWRKPIKTFKTSKKVIWEFLWVSKSVHINIHKKVFLIFDKDKYLLLQSKKKYFKVLKPHTHPWLKFCFLSELKTFLKQLNARFCIMQNIFLCGKMVLSNKSYSLGNKEDGYGCDMFLTHDFCLQ